MNLTSIKFFFCRSDVRIVIFGTATGAILQILSKKYIKNNPEFLKDSPESKETHPRGGAISEIIATRALAQAILSFLAEHGLTAGLISSTSVVISRIPVTSISKYLREALPQSLSHLEKKKYIMVGKEKIYLDQCDQNLKYLFKIVEDETIPFEEKKKVSHLILTKYLNLRTQSGRRNFVLCIVSLLSILSTNNNSSFYIMMQNLIKAIREGKISKAMARLIIRRLKNKGIPIDPELADIVAS